ncbi:MAG: ABC transporter ATP-binding protein, partial [Adlercreutzia sp.]|nr:ABC transporter ATP-binding protein [Adlercreutzia sp.]
MTAALTVEHLTKSFGGRKAVDDVSFTLPEG